MLYIEHFTADEFANLSNKFDGQLTVLPQNRPPGQCTGEDIGTIIRSRLSDGIVVPDDKSAPVISHLAVSIPDCIAKCEFDRSYFCDTVWEFCRDHYPDKYVLARHVTEHVPGAHIMMLPVYQRKLCYEAFTKNEYLWFMWHLDDTLAHRFSKRGLVTDHVLKDSNALLYHDMLLDK